MKRLGLACFLIAVLLSTAFANLNLNLIGEYHTGLFNESGAEISAYDPATQRLFVVNANAGLIDVLDISNPAAPVFLFNLSAVLYGGAEINSVDVHNGIVAVAAQASPKTNPGIVVFFDPNGLYLNHVVVGALPDHVVFSPNGNYVVTCNEGEPNDTYAIDPEGSVSVINISGGVLSATVATADFHAYDTQLAALRASGVRIYGPGATVSQDLEPEFAAIDPYSSIAYVTLQENNALAIVNLATATVIGIQPFGYKNWMTGSNSLDPSDRDSGININHWPTLGMYQPDGIAAYQPTGATYLITANEGDARDYDGYSEEARCRDLTLNPVNFPNAATLRQNGNLGRLKVTTATGDSTNNGNYEAIYSYGARSFSIWNSSGTLIYDSGDDIEQHIAALLPSVFNSSNDANGSFDSRSDDKGPEPENVVVEQICGRFYAFIGLERVGGVIVYDVSDPAHPFYVTYMNSRDFSATLPGSSGSYPAQMAAVKELGPEGLLFINENDSPNGQHLLVVSNEVSGSVTIYEVSNSMIVETAGSYCVSLCANSSFHIILPIDDPNLYLDGVSFTPGCSPGNSNCDDDCTPGAGQVDWTWEFIEGEWHMIVTLSGAGAESGCFCLTIDNILPVEMGEIAAVGGDNQVALSWNTLSETNIDYFAINRGELRIAEVAGQGNSAYGHSYSWIDNNVVNGTTYEYTLFAVSTDGELSELTTLEATPTATATPLEYELGAAFPNPFNPSTQFTYAIPEAGFVSVKVFDVTGRELATLVNSNREAGVHTVTFDAAGLPSGLYFYRLQAGDFSASRKMMLMK